MGNYAALFISPHADRVAVAFRNQITLLQKDNDYQQPIGTFTSKLADLGNPSFKILYGAISLYNSGRSSANKWGKIFVLKLQDCNLTTNWHVIAPL